MDTEAETALSDEHDQQPHSHVTTAQNDTVGSCDLAGDTGFPADDANGVDQQSENLDLTLPLSTVTKIVKDAIPSTLSVSKDARIYITRSATIFLLYLVHEATLVTTRKTLSHQDIVEAVKAAGLKELVAPLEHALQAYRDGLASSKAKDVRRSEAQSSQMPAAQATSSTCAKVAANPGEHGNAPDVINDASRSHGGDVTDDVSHVGGVSNGVFHARDVTNDASHGGDASGDVSHGGGVSNGVSHADDLSNGVSHVRYVTDDVSHVGDTSPDVTG